MNKQNSINVEVLLLCERLEIAQFMHAYLRHLFKQGEHLPNMQIINFQGFDKLPLLTKKLRLMDGCERVSKAVFIADAADELEWRMQKFFAVRDNTFFREVKYCTHFFFPGRKKGHRWRHGFLEDILLEALYQETSEYSDYYNLYSISEEYLKMVNNCRGRDNKLLNYNRHFLYTYLAVTDKYVGLRLGEAALAGAFNLEYEGFDSLRECLKKLY